MSNLYISNDNETFLNKLEHLPNTQMMEYFKVKWCMSVYICSDKRYC